MKEWYFKVVPDGSDEKSGMPYGPKDCAFPLVVDGRDIKDWEKLEFELKDGEYRHFLRSVEFAYLVSENLKSLLEEYLEEKETVEFLPVKVKSKEYGDRTYYILHFKNRPEDVISKPHTMYHNQVILKYALDYDKVKDKKVFNVKGNDLHVSADIAKAMKERKMTQGMDFWSIPSFSADE